MEVQENQTYFIQVWAQSEYNGRIFVISRVTDHSASPMWYGIGLMEFSQNSITTAEARSTGSFLSRLRGKSARVCWREASGCQPLANWLACLD